MKKYLIPIGYSLGIILVGTLISSILYYFSITTDKLNTIFLYSIGILSIFIGSLKLGKNLKHKGIITGLIYFTGFLILMLFLTLFIFRIRVGAKNLIYYLVLLVFSLLGGILGKNMNEEADIS